MVEAVVEAHAVEPRLHQLLTEQVPRVGRLGALMEDLDGHVATAVRAWLEAHRAELRVTDLETATYVVVHAVEAVVHRGVVARNGARNTALTELDLGFFVESIDLFGWMVEECVADEIVLFRVVPTDKQKW